MNNIKISIIIPVHNGELYLQPCLQSVVQQSLQGVEIFVINDASSDGSQSIIDDFASRYDSIKPIKLDQNKGVSTARNICIDKASGDYVIFLDCDDYWDDNRMLQNLYDTAVHEQADIISFGFCRVNDAGEKSGFTTAKAGPVNLKQQNDWLPAYNIWAKLVSRNLLIDNNIRFEPTWGEDALFSISLYCHAEKMYVIDENYYHYRNNPQGESQIRWDSNKLFGTVRWFSIAIDIIQNSDIFKHYPEMLQIVSTERLMMLFKKLGPMALDVFSDKEQEKYFRLWTQCLQHFDIDYYKSQMQNKTDVDFVLRLLNLLSQNDLEGIRAYFTSEQYRRFQTQKQAPITISQQQAKRLGKDILGIDKAHIRCNFGNGDIVTLPKDKAHQLAKQLISNQNETITLRFS